MRLELNENTKNIGYLFLVEFAVRLISFVAFAYLARVLGKSDFGIVSMGLAFLSYGLIFSNNGLSVLAVRKVAANYQPIEELTARIFVLRLLLTIIILAFGGAIISVFVSSAKIVEVSLLYLLSMIPAAFLLEWYFQGKQKMGYIAGGRTIAMLFYLIFILIFVQSGKDILYTPIGWTIGIIANAVFLFYIHCKQNESIFKHLNNLKVLSLFKETLPFGGASILAEIVTKFPILYIGFALSTTESGSYSAAFRIIIFLLAIDRIFAALFYPKIVSILNNSSTKLDELFSNVLKLIVSISIFVGTVTVLLGELLVEFIVGATYLSSVPILQLLVGYFILTLINSVFTYTLYAMQKEIHYMKSLFFGAILFIISCVIFTDIWGSLGTAGSLIIFEITVLILMYFFIHEKITINIIRNIFIPLFMFLGIILFCLFILELSMFIEFIIGLFLIILMLIYGLGLGRRDIQFLTGF